jgi:hypothetical protein
MEFLQVKSDQIVRAESGAIARRGACTGGEGWELEKHPVCLNHPGTRFCQAHPIPLRLVEIVKRRIAETTEQNRSST